MSERETGQHEDEAARRRKVLKRSQASRVRSISDAVVIKDGDPFFLCPPDGQIPLDGAHGYGLYHHDTRFLAGYEMHIAGIVPESLAATAAAGRTAILELTNPEIDLGPDHTIAKERLAIHWSRALDGKHATLVDTLEIRNHDAADATLAVRTEMATRFRDIFEIRGLLDEPPGDEQAPAWHGDRLVFAFDGRDHVRRSLSATFDPPPSKHEGTAATIELAVPGRGTAAVQVTLRMRERVAAGSPPIEGGSEPHHAEARPTGGRAVEGRLVGGAPWATAVGTDSPAFDGVMRRSLADLDLLRARLDGQSFYGAGLPWFSALFGRDALIAALQTLAFDPSIAAGTLRLLAGRQGDKVDRWRDEEPGKILHELRVGELARLDRIPQTPYYGSVDATPLFLIVLAEHAAWTGSLALFGELRDHVDRALGWLDEHGDDDGYIGYASTADGGLVNQGWKDSGDGIVDGDGRIAKPPIIMAEVQGYVYLARQRIADMLDRDGQPDRARTLRRQADHLRERFERDFWSDELGCYVMALQADREPCAVVSSNAGQVLLSGIASPAHAEAVERRLLADDMFSGWGVRTLSADAIAYNPIGYHLGTVWPHDNSLIATGFRRYGLDEAAAQIMDGLLEAAADFAHARLPECFAGLERAGFGIPVRYPVACHPQAWAAGSVPYLTVQTLGLEPDALDSRLRVVRPRLPGFVDRLELRGLPVGQARVDLQFRRDGASTTVEVRQVRGDLHVQIDVTGAAGA